MLKLAVHVAIAFLKKGEFMKKTLYLIFCLLISKEIFCNDIKIEGKRPDLKSMHVLFILSPRHNSDHIYKIHEFASKDSKVLFEIKNKDEGEYIKGCFFSKYSGASRVISSREKSGDFYKVYYKKEKTWGWLHKDNFSYIGHIENYICSKEYESFQSPKELVLFDKLNGNKIDLKERKYQRKANIGIYEFYKASCLGGKWVKDRLWLHFEIVTYDSAEDWKEDLSTAKTVKVWFSPFNDDGTSATFMY